MRLSPASWVRYGFVVTWPPEAIDEIEHAAGKLMIRFRDPWSPYERLSTESLWHGEYVDRWSWWAVRRVRFLDYERTDSPIL